MDRPAKSGRRLTGATVRDTAERQGFLVLILGLALAVRLYDFGSVPPGLNQDEASTGYDTWAVMHYGIDRNGFHLPMMFVSWGSGMYALPGYLAMPFYAVLGFSVDSLRTVNLIAGLASVPALYLVVRETGDRTLALIAAFLLAISPWHIMISRWGLDSNLLPAVFLFGVLFLLRASRSPRSYIWAAV